MSWRQLLFSLVWSFVALNNSFGFGSAVRALLWRGSGRKASLGLGKPGFELGNLSAAPFVKAAAWICRTETERIIRGYKGLGKIKQRVDQAYLVLRQVCLLAAIGFFRSWPCFGRVVKAKAKGLGKPSNLWFSFLQPC